MTKDEALKLALEALEVFATSYSDGNAAITALRQALEQPAQQEPVAVVSGYYGGQCVILPIDPARIYNSNTPLYTTPQPCPTCEALARTVMLDQTSHDAQRKPLTDKEIDAVMPQPAEFGIVQPPWNGLDITILRAMARATEAAHNIKE